jgi:hypothetical protein
VLAHPPSAGWANTHIRHPSPEAFAHPAKTSLQLLAGDPTPWPVSLFRPASSPACPAMGGPFVVFPARRPGGLGPMSGVGHSPFPQHGPSTACPFRGRAFAGPTARLFRRTAPHTGRAGRRYADRFTTTSARGGTAAPL